MEYYFIWKDISLESHSKIMGITIQGLGNVSNFSGLYTPNINIDWTHIYTLILLDNYNFIKSTFYVICLIKKLVFYTKKLIPYLDLFQYFIFQY